MRVCLPGGLYNRRPDAVRSPQFTQCKKKHREGKSCLAHRHDTNRTARLTRGECGHGKARTGIRNREVHAAQEPRNEGIPVEGKYSGPFLLGTTPLLGVSSSSPLSLYSTHFILD